MNTQFRKCTDKTEYRNVCLLADKELHDKFIELAEINHLTIGEIILDETEKRNFCKRLKYDYPGCYSIITHK